MSRNGRYDATLVVSTSSSLCINYRLPMDFRGLSFTFEAHVSVDVVVVVGQEYKDEDEVEEDDIGGVSLRLRRSIG